MAFWTSFANVSDVNTSSSSDETRLAAIGVTQLICHPIYRVSQVRSKTGSTYRCVARILHEAMYFVLDFVEVS